HGGEVLSILPNFNHLLRLRTIWNLDLPLLPHPRDIGLPSFAHAAYETVGTTQEQHVRSKCMPARKHAEILKHDGFEQRCHQLVRRRPNFLQTVNVSFREHATLARNLVQLDAVISLLRELLR